MTTTCIICLESEDVRQFVKPCESCLSVAFCEKCWEAYVTRGYRTCPQCKKNVLVLASPPSSPPPPSTTSFVAVAEPQRQQRVDEKTRRLKDILILHTFSSWSVLFTSLALGHGMLMTRLSLGVIGFGTTYMLRSLHRSVRIISNVEGYCNATVFVGTIVFWLLMIANVALYDRCIEFVVFVVESFLLFWLFVHGMIHWTDEVSRVVPGDGRGSDSDRRPSEAEETV